MLLLNLALSAFALTTVAKAAVIPTSDVTIISRAVAVDAPLPLTDKALATVMPRKAANAKIVLAGFATSAAITVGACTFGGPIVCGIAAVVSVLNIFFTTYKEYQKNDAPIIPPRAVAYGNTTIHAPFTATAGCGVLCQLNKTAVPGEWTHFASTSANGINHNVHYRKIGSIHGLRASGQSAVVKRQSDDSADEGGYVAAYYWEEANANDWSNWDTSADEGLAEEAANYMFAGSYGASCLDLEDDDGSVVAAMLTLDTDNTESVYSDDYVQQALDFCGRGDGLNNRI